MRKFMMKYLMLFLFPPVGIVMYLKDEFGPPKKIRLFVCLISLLWMGLIIYMIAQVPLQRHQEQVQLESQIFDDPLAGKIENKIEKINKTDFDKLSDREKAEKIQSFLSDAIGDYAAIIFDDGTGIQFPGAEMTTAWYGNIQEDGEMVTTLGEVKISNGVYVLTEYPKEDLIEVDISNVLPDKYKSDATSIDVRKTSDGYYLAFATICEEPTDDDYNTIINVAKQYGITSGRITFVDEFSVIMGKRSWPEDTINEPNPSNTPSTETVGGTEG